MQMTPLTDPGVEILRLLIQVSSQLLVLFDSQLVAIAAGIVICQTLQALAVVAGNPVLHRSHLDRHQGRNLMGAFAPLGPEHGLQSLGDAPLVFFLQKALELFDGMMSGNVHVENLATKLHSPMYRRYAVLIEVVRSVAPCTYEIPKSNRYKMAVSG